MSDSNSDMIDETIVAVNTDLIAHFSDLGKRFDPVRIGFCAVGSAITWLAARGSRCNSVRGFLRSD